MNQEQVDDYLFHCKNLSKTPSESFFKHSIYGLRALYKLLDKTDVSSKLPQIKRTNKLPVVLHKDEVKQLLSAPKYLRHRLILACLYGCGLRSYELCNLRLSDVDLHRNTLLIKKQKGNTDRYVPIGKMLSRGLQNYIENERPKVYLFNSQKCDTGQVKPLTTRAIQWVIKENRTKVATHKTITAHCLRHSYATHLLEAGLNIVALKELLGHARIETTLVYLHVANTGSSEKINPLDLIYS